MEKETIKEMVKGLKDLNENTGEQHHLKGTNKTVKFERDKESEEDFRPLYCPHCSLDLDLHDGSGFCPPGTEEFGGRR